MPIAQKNASIFGGNAPPPATPALKFFPSITLIFLKTKTEPKNLSGQRRVHGMMNKNHHNPV